MNPATMAVTLFSVLFPIKAWFGPDQALTVQVRPEAGTVITLVLTDFTGKVIESSRDREFNGEQSVDLKQMFQPILTPGTYMLWAVPKGKILPEFVGTPLVIETRSDERRDAPAGPMVIKIEPLSFARIVTDKGDFTMMFYYDAAPHTVSNFIGLARGGFYDGLLFHRIVPGFVIQSGDPRGDGTGGPGYNIGAEFNEREHRPGIVSMARQGDPLESQGAPPRTEFANSGGSQFFICLDYERTKQLDRRYTVFGKVMDGMKVVEAIGATSNANADQPNTPPTIKSVTIESVTPGKNPYEAMMEANLPKARS